MYESEDRVEEIGELNRVDHWWYSIIKMKALVGERKYPMLENSVIERSLSDNNNTVQTERNNMLEETIISLKMHSKA